MNTPPDPDMPRVRRRRTKKYRKSRTMPGSDRTINKTQPTRVQALNTIVGKCLSLTLRTPQRRRPCRERTTAWREWYARKARRAPSRTAQRPCLITSREHPAAKRLSLNFFLSDFTSKSITDFEGRMSTGRTNQARQLVNGKQDLLHEQLGRLRSRIRAVSVRWTACTN